MVALQGGGVLLRKNASWKSAGEGGAKPGRPAPPLPFPSLHVLQRVVQDKRTFWQSQDLSALGPTDSLAGVESIVAAPILDAAGGGLGAGHRDFPARRRAPPPPPLSPGGALPLGAAA